EYDYAPNPDTEIDNMGINMNNTEKQTQVTIKCPNEKEYQATMDSSSDTNGTEVEMIDTTENGLATPEMQITGNEHVESYTLEIAIKTTQPEDTEWLHSEEFILVINKKSVASKKNKKN
ncbi:5149_t:CDS:2, partial [Gigaspora margarita]